MNAAKGWTLFIDQASNAAGVTLVRDGHIIKTTTIRSVKSTDPISRRLQVQVDRLTSFLDSYLAAGEVIENVVFEGVRSRLVLISVGAFLTCPRISAKIHQRHNFIESTSWKKWAQKRGATGPLKLIKGRKALSEAKPGSVDAYDVQTDDEADSIMMFFTYMERYHETA